MKRAGSVIPAEPALPSAAAGPQSAALGRAEIGPLSTERDEAMGRAKALVRTRTRKVLALLSVMAVFGGGSALAAWIIYSGGHGTSSGTITTATMQDAVTVSQDPSNNTPVAGPGQTGTDTIDFTNKSGVDETITGATATITSTPADCASHLSVNSSALTGRDVPTNGSFYSTTVSADSSLPTDCSGGSYTINWVLTTSP